MTSFKSLLSQKVLEQAGTSVGRRLLHEYGAIFATGGGAIPPDRIIYRDDNEVTAFQNSVSIDTVRFGDVVIELQSAAAKKLSGAIGAAKDAGLSITPRGVDSGRRNYDETVSLWHSRVEPALDHWVARGRLSPIEAAEITKLLPFEQVPVVLSLEEKGIFFAKDLTKSILYSVAPPGASQHLSMLAFDVAQFNDPKVRQILAEHYWYQTVVSDLPHFTFLGVPESEMIALDLKKVIAIDREFWLPSL
jgi:hypothetical protein